MQASKLYKLAFQIRSRVLHFGVACGLTGGLVTAILVPSIVKAIPEAEAYKKLEVIPVFVITDPKGIPLPISREKSLVLPLYLDSIKAKSELAALKKSNPTQEAIVTPVPLNRMNEMVVAFSEKLKNKSKPLVAPVMVSDSDRQQAVTLLKAEGLTEKQIQEYLSVPVFFTRPLLLLNTPEGPRGVFFLGYGEMQRALSTVPEAERAKRKPQVADLSVVLQQIIKDPKDNFIIYPTPEYFRLVAESKGGADGGANSVSMAPVFSEVKGKSVKKETTGASSVGAQVQTRPQQKSQLISQANSGDKNFGVCYSQLIAKGHNHSDVSFFCSCHLDNANRFPTFEATGQYCSNALAAKTGRERSEFYKTMIPFLMPRPAPTPINTGLDVGCALARAQGLPCAGDKRVKCRDSVDFLGRSQTVCEEF